MSWFLQKEIENDDFPKNNSLIEWWEKKKNIDYAQNGRKEMVISSNGVEAKGSLKYITYGMGYGRTWLS